MGEEEYRIASPASRDRNDGGILRLSDEETKGEGKIRENPKSKIRNPK